MRFTLVIGRIAGCAIAVAFAVLLVSAVACGGDSSSPSPGSTLPTSTASFVLPRTVLPGDPAVYGDALARFQQYLDVWMAGDTTAKNAMLEPVTQPGSVPNPQLLGAAIIYYRGEEHISDNEFTLLITFQLHFSASNESAWGEGANSRFITFKRADASSPFMMKFATSPPLILPE